MYLSCNILIFFKTKSLQNFFTTYERCQVVTMQARILQTLLLTEVRNVPFNDIQTKYQSLWTEEKDLKFLLKKNSPGYEGKKGTVAQAPLIVATHLATCQFTHPVLGKVTARSARPRRQGADHWKKYIIMNYIM